MIGTVMESGTLPQIPPGLSWSPGLCWGCLTERDVTPLGGAELDGTALALSACRWCLAALRQRLAAVQRWHQLGTVAGQRAHRVAQWSRALRRRRHAEGRHRAPVRT
ncbi:hypothetical protein AB0D08_20155 [Kitasatospora sp. NPDC048540]|uniref:hypothetical protein n=1 Tax=unclassified Kitasatospora TaxID=2633591 RepID=UPI00053A5295|nr:hypothetical protein [Kitasatospora sp. MBT63]